jgi:hypothetical protein
MSMNLISTNRGPSLLSITHPILVDVRIHPTASRASSDSAYQLDLLHFASMPKQSFSTLHQCADHHTVFRQCAFKKEMLSEGKVEEKDKESGQDDVCKK